MHLTRTKKQQALVRISLLFVLFRHGGKAQQDKQCLLTYGPLNGKLNTTNLSQGSPSVRSSHTLISFYAFCDFFCNLSQFFRLKKEEKNAAILWTARNGRNRGNCCGNFWLACRWNKSLIFYWFEITSIKARSLIGPDLKRLWLHLSCRYLSNRN